MKSARRQVVGNLLCVHSSRNWTTFLRLLSVFDRWSPLKNFNGAMLTANPNYSIGTKRFCRAWLPRKQSTLRINKRCGASIVCCRETPGIQPDPPFGDGICPKYGKLRKTREPVMKEELTRRATPFVNSMRIRSLCGILKNRLRDDWKSQNPGVAEKAYDDDTNKTMYFTPLIDAIKFKGMRIIE